MNDDPSDDKVPFAIPDITQAEIDAVREVMESRWITTGPRAAEFERTFAEQVGARHAVAVNSCTAALHLALEAFGVGPSDLVYVPTYTFAASAEVVRYLGAHPVLIDVDPVTCNIDVGALGARVERDHADAASGRPAAVIPVHIAGVPCDMMAIWDLARAFDLAVIEDAAHAFPAARRGVTVGHMPDDVRSAVCYSFYATKTITTGEGGMLVTNDSEISNRARSMSLHGLSRQAWDRYQAGGTWRYDIAAPGYKYNLTDIAAAMGLVQLRRAESMAQRRAEIAEVYTRAFKPYDGLTTPTVPDGVTSAWHLYMLRTENEAARDSLIAFLTERGIGVSVHFIPLHLHSYYRETYGTHAGDLPVATEQFNREVSLPIFSGMTDAQVDRVKSAVEQWARAQKHR